MQNLALNQFQVVRVIGVGTFSQVKLCYHSPSEAFCILKIMSKQRLIELNQIEHIQNEKEILQVVQHPNAVVYYGSFQDHDHIYMMMEYIPGGEVFSHLRTLGRFDYDVVRFYAAEILLVFQHLHTNHIIYRDLKPENLLFSVDGHIKFIDFGFAKRIQDRTYTLCGTPEYLAPEVIRGEGASYASDWWAYGILIYEMLVGQTPFVDENENKMYQNICSGQFTFPNDETLYIDECTYDLITGLLTVDTSKRLGCTAQGANEIRAHPWFEGIEWDKVYEHRYQAPLVPYVESMSDTINFPEYPEEEIIDPPLTSPVPPHAFDGF